MLSMMPITRPMLLDAMLLDEMLFDAPRPRCPARSSVSLSSCRPQVTEDNDRFVITMQAPGMKASDLSVTVADNEVLKIKAETPNGSDGRASHSINWAVRLPHADAENVEASHVDGLLEIVVFKKAMGEAKSVLVANSETTEAEAEESAYKVQVNAAGFAKENITITVEDGDLKIDGESARIGARLSRSIKLPRDANDESIRASHVDGLLTVTIPKKAAAEDKVIEVKDAITSAAMMTASETEDSVMV